MNSTSILDQLLNSGRALLGELNGGAGPAARGGGLSDFGKGALSGGALGLLLGNKKLRKMGGKLAAYGGLAALGVLAYRAYGDWQKSQGGNTAPPQTVDRVPPAQVEAHSRDILKALVAAARADGHIDGRERQLLEAEFARLGGDESLQVWLEQELSRPLEPATVAAAAASAEMAAEMYLASVMMVDEQSFMERAYLDELGRCLGLERELCRRLEGQVQGVESGA